MKKNKVSAKGNKTVQKKKTDPAIKRMVDISVFVLIVLAVTYFVLTFVTQRTMVKGTSMETTLYSGDNIMIDKLSYRLRDIKRGEIICFRADSGRDTLIKRVIGLPGETVMINQGSIYIDGEIINDYIGGLSFAGLAENGVTLDGDEYFVLGDNRRDSIDSRYSEVGFVKRRDILGRAFFLFYPFNRMRIVK